MVMLRIPEHRKLTMSRQLGTGLLDGWLELDKCDISCVIVLLMLAKCTHILTKNMQLLILFMDSAMGIWQQLFQNMRDDSQNSEHLIVFPCMHQVFLRRR